MYSSPNCTAMPKTLEPSYRNPRPNPRSSDPEQTKKGKHRGLPIIGVTPFRVLITLLISYLLSPLPLQIGSTWTPKVCRIKAFLGFWAIILSTFGGPGRAEPFRVGIWGFGERVEGGGVYVGVSGWGATPNAELILQAGLESMGSWGFISLSTQRPQSSSWSFWGVHI